MGKIIAYLSKKTPLGFCKVTLYLTLLRQIKLK